MIRGPAKTAQTLYNARRNVSSRRIDHGIVIGKRNIAEEPAIVVAVKGAPAAIAILHTEQPLNAAANGAFHALRIGIGHALERHQNEGSVVNIGVEIIAEFKGPATGLGVFVLDLPVARTEHLLAKHPF